MAVGEGETLLVRDWGPLDGPPVVFHHAMPACSLTVPGGWGAADEAGDDGTNDLLVSNVIRTNELQVWFLAEHLVDAPVVEADEE